MGNRVNKEDILNELFNISVGKSASLLSEIINKKIILCVPKIKIVNLNEETISPDNYLPQGIQGSVMLSSIGFREELRGKASLIFPADKTKAFVHLCLNQIDQDFSDLCFTDIDFDIIREIGNIILNTVIGEIANFLKIKLNYTLSEVKVFSKEDFNTSINNKEYSHIIILYITFKIDDTEIEGAIIINLSLTSLSQLLNKLEKIEDDFCE